MNKIFFLLLTLTTISLNAQQFRYGVNIAPQASWWIVDGDLYIYNGTKVGLQAGFMIDQTLGEKERFALSTGLNYNFAPGGFETNPEGQNPDNPKEFNFKVMSLDLPLMVKLRSDQLNKTVLYAQYGLTLGFTLAKGLSGANGQTVTGVDYEGMNMSLTMGVGGEVELASSKTLLIGTYFQNGIVNMLIDNAKDDDMYPQHVGLRVGMFF